MSVAGPSPTGAAGAFRPDEEHARRLDGEDPLRSLRGRFEMPKRPDGTDVVYLCGNSLGLQPAAARTLVEQELDDWARLAVDAHFKGRTPWYSYHEVFRDTGARLVGARPGEVVMMNSLTVNLHLLMVSFYRPEGRRRKVLMEAPAFPSDTYAVRTHLHARGFDPHECVITVGPRAGEHIVRTEDIESVLEREGDEIALVLIGGVNFLSGQAFDIARITAAAHARGCLAGFDLAHAAGNLDMHLHDWDVDFAAWCSYKYLNGGPGAIAGCFIHERHARDVRRPRFGGWWGNDPATRFRMQLEPGFVPKTDADGWQVSNPPILAMAPLRASLEIFDEVGMAALREKSLRLTGYLRSLLESAAARDLRIITPSEPEARGCQLSIEVDVQARERFEALQAAGVVCDFRPPNVIRVAPVPLYNSFLDAWTFARLLSDRAGG